MLGFAFSKFLTHAVHASCDVADVRTRIVVVWACVGEAVAAPAARSAERATTAARATRVRMAVDDIGYLLCLLGFRCRRQRPADRDRSRRARRRGGERSRGRCRAGALDPERAVEREV